MFFNFPKVELEHTSALIFTVYLPSMKQPIKGLRESLSIEERIVGEKFKDFYLQDLGCLFAIVGLVLARKSDQEA